MHPRAGPGRQLDIQHSGAVAGQRLGCVAEERGLVAGVERVPRLVVHQHHVLGQRKDGPAGVPAGPQVLPQQLELRGAAVVEQALRDLAGSALGERDQQPAASLRQLVRFMAPTALPEIGWRIGTAAQARSSRCSA